MVHAGQTFFNLIGGDATGETMKLYSSALIIELWNIKTMASRFVGADNDINWCVHLFVKLRCLLMFYFNKVHCNESLF